MNTVNDAVALKLYKEGMLVYVNKAMSFDELEANVTDKFKKSESFFKGLTLKVGFKGVELEKDEYDKLMISISDAIGCKAVLWENPEPFEQVIEENSVKDLSAEQILNNAFRIEIDDECTKFYTKTIRSGQLLESDGNIVVVGDVNPGAELVATGNIVVMGALKGTVHAGAKGNRDAIVVALNLSPIQLRIANVISRSPDVATEHGIIPEIAYVREDKIFIEDFLQKRK